MTIIPFRPGRHAGATRYAAAVRRGTSAILFAILLAAGVAATPAGAGPAAPAHGPDRPVATPVARAGSPLASDRALTREALRDELAAAMRSAGGASGAWVADVDGGGELFRDSASERRVPASNQKLFTTAAFLDRLGADGRLETRVFARGRRSGTRGRVLRGDLVIVGDGDPALGTSRFARSHDLPLTSVSELARSVARSGVRKVTGKVRADDSIFDRKRRSGPYLSPLSGLSFNSGYDGSGYAKSPELLAAKRLRRSLAEKGVRVARGVGRTNLGGRALRRDPLGSVASPAVSSLIAETNKPSNNFFAEMLLKRLGAEGGKRGTRNAGAKRVESFARSVGTDVQAVDGSGLSRRNRVSAQEVGELLVAMEEGDEAAAFSKSLAIAGRDGTLADRMRGTAAEGACRGKTGTLDGVSALSGYCEAGSNTIAFAILMNSVDITAAHRAQDRMAAAIARYRP
jgi:D-alanyl-D-alanine carboxypeptidase/D-alanyl-D-alanine-endopeptidase (penicillin-binding protein 4)